MRSALRMRFSYGRIVPWVHKVENRTVAVAGPDSVWLDTDVETFGEDLTTYADFTVSAGERVAFTLSWQPSHREAPAVGEPEAALEATADFWREWVEHCTYHGPYREAVVRSLITLKALTYAPTGGIVAAPTTSLPEEIGGVRNWDYRFTWLRDAAITLSSLLRTGYREEARAWREWLLRAVAGDPENLQIMYGIAGERELGESELDWLPGYENSGPVRVGNGAAHQLQLDVYGEVTEALHLAHMTGLARNDYASLLQLRLIGYLEKHWTEPDEGIWEVRGPRRHFVHSKVMAWVAVDRTIKLIESGDAEGPWSAGGRCATTSTAMSARRATTRNATRSPSPTDPVNSTRPCSSSPRWASCRPTTSASSAPSRPSSASCPPPTASSCATPPLGDDAGVDGLAGDEGAFLACSFWLADDLAMIGRVDEARKLFEKLLALRNDLGLLAEEWDPHLKRQVGNFPQAFSHVPLIDTALRLTASGAYGG